MSTPSAPATGPTSGPASPAATSPPLRLDAQTLLLVGSLALCSVWPTPELWTWLAAYGVAWLAFNYVPGLAKPQIVQVRPAAIVVLALLLATPALAFLWQERETVARREGLRGLGTWIDDRLRLEDAPILFPPVVAGDRPQSLYVQARDAAAVRIHLGDGVSPLDGVALGHGLFRVAYDPRTDGAPSAELAMLDVQIEADGSTARRSLRYVRWQSRPSRPCADPERGLAAVPSEETDELFVLARDEIRSNEQNEQNEQDRQDEDRPGALTSTLAVGDGPTECAFVADGLVAVAHRYDRELMIVDPASGAVVARADVGPFQVSVDASKDGKALVVARSGDAPEIVRLAFDPATAGLEIVERLALDGSLDEHLAPALEPTWVRFVTPADEEAGTPLRLVLSSRRHRAVFRLDRERSSEGDRSGAWSQSEIYVGRAAAAAALSTDRRTLYVAASDYRPDGEEHRGNHFIQDQILRIDVDAWTVVGQRLTGRRSARQDYPGDTDRGASPVALAALPAGDLLIAFAGSDEAWRVDGALAEPPVVYTGSSFELIAPRGIADLGNGVWLATSPAGGCMALYDADGTMLEFVAVSPTDDELASADEGSLARQDLDLRGGERAFWEATRSGIACQSCHIDGGTDHAPHDIGQSSMLPTLTTRGVAGTAPYLRDGSFPRVRDLHFDLADPLYRGYRRFEARRPELLEGFVHALVADVNPALFAARDLERERAGLDAFVRARCDVCHALPATTNLSRHPSRWLFPEHEASETLFLDTPSLLAVHAKPDFLQDGRAHELLDVLDAENEANRHGDTAALSDDEKRALVHFLESL